MATNTERRFLFLLGSARTDGNTQQLARLAAAGLPASAGQHWIDLRETTLDDFNDRRHTGNGVSPLPEGNEKVLFDQTLAATDIVIVSPLYWYSVSADVKRYLDYWSGWMRIPEAEFRPKMRDKTLWGVTVFSEEDTAQTDPLVGMLHKSADYMKMNWGGVLIGYGNRPGDLRDAPAAASFFQEAPQTLNV